MQKDHFHTLNPFLESRNEHIQDSKLSTLQPWNGKRQEVSDDVEFQACEYITNGYTPCSPSLWTQRALGDNIKNQASNLLPCYDYFGQPFPGSRLQAIRDGRKNLMRMIQDLPESSFELSLKDIVENHQSTEEGQQAETFKGNNPKVRMPQQSKTLKRSQISRSESMDSGVFLLKMFLPSSIGSKKKLKPKNSSKVSPKTPVDESEKSMNKDWWRIIYVVIKENKYSRSIKKSMSYNSSSKSRLVERNCTQRKQRGCFFLV